MKRYVSVNNLETESDEDYKSRWLSIRILYVTMFFDSLSFSIVLSSLWPYLQKIDPNPELSPLYVAWANVGFQLAGICMDFVNGFWTNKRGSTEPLLMSLFLFGFGNLLYGYAQAVGDFGIPMILLSRTIIGLSTGVNVVARAVAAEATSLKERTTVMAHMSIAQGAGFSFGPAIQLATVPLGDKGIYIAPLKLHLNLYTAPAFVSILIAIVNIVTVLGWYQEHHVDIYKDHEGNEEVTKYKNLIRHHGLEKTNHDQVAVIANLFLYFVVQSAFALDETLLSPLTMDQLGWTRSETALWVGIIFLGAGIIAILVFALTDVLEKWFNGRNILLFGFFVLLLGFAVFLPWGDEYPKLKPTESSFHPKPNHTIHQILNKSTISKDLVGCPQEYDWCKTTPKIHLFQIIMGMVFLAIGYPFALVLSTTIYSKILRPTKQGLMQSWLAAVGGLARTAGPAAVTYMYVKVGPRWTFLSVDGLIIISILVLIISYKRLIPYHLYILKKNENKVKLISEENFTLTESTDSSSTNASSGLSGKEPLVETYYLTVL